MAKAASIPAPILNILRGQYLKAVEYQFHENYITVQMSFDEYLSLWSNCRIATLERKKAQGIASLRRYLTDKHNRPVLGWKNREDRQHGGVMTVEMARIVRAEDSRRQFQFKAGDKHKASSRARIGDGKRGKKQTPEQIAKRTAARVATMALKRAEREADKN